MDNLNDRKILVGALHANILQYPKKSIIKI